MRNEQSGGLPRYRQVSVVSIQGSTDQDYENYKYFMDHYGPVLRGVTDYNAECADKVPEEWLTLWEEAFGFFMLENYKEQVTTWVKENKRINSAYAQSGTAKRNQGYSVQGMTRWKELLHDVKARRDTDKKNADQNTVTFGERYMAEKVKEREKKIERGTKRKQDTTAEREKPYKDACGEDDLFDGLKYDKIVATPV